MNVEELESALFEVVGYEFPRLSIEDIGEIVSDVGDSWDWNPDNLQYMEKYIQNKVWVFSRKEFINEDLDLYHSVCEESFQLNENPNPDDVIEDYRCKLIDKYECHIWEGWMDKRGVNLYGEMEKCYIWLE